MNGNEVLRIVDAIHRDKAIDKEIVFEGIEQAILSAARKHFGEEDEIIVDIDRESGQPTVKCNDEDLLPDEIGDLLGRIAAQTAKQVMIQKIREAERDALFDEYTAMQSHIISGTVSRVEGSAATINLGKVEGILPRSESIPGESHRVNDRIRAVILEVRKAGSRVKIILSRTHIDFVRRLFEIEIPEVAERVIEVRSLAREAGYRSKVAVSCYDTKIDCVGACVGVRGARIKSIVDELAGERIDIVRWNDSLQVLVPNALQPAEVEDVILCPMLGKVIVLVREDQLSLAIGKKGQNVRLASKLVGWDINVMTQNDLDEKLEDAVMAFASVPEVTEELAESLVSQGFFSFDDLSVIEPDQLAELGGLTESQCDSIIEYADEESAKLEAEEIRQAQERRRQAALESEQAELETVTRSDEPEAEEPASTDDTDGGADANHESAGESPEDGTATAVDDAEPSNGNSADSTADEAGTTIETESPADIGGEKSPEDEETLKKAEASASEE